MSIKIEVEWLDDKKSRCKFALPAKEEWTAADVTDVMHVLGQLRGGMSPAFPNDPPLFESVAAETNPRWWSNLDEMSGGTLLMFRHASLGWLPYFFPIHERKKMIDVFQEQERIYGEKKRVH